MKKTFEVTVPAFAFFTSDAIGFAEGKTDKPQLKEKYEQECSAIRELFYLDDDADISKEELTIRCRLEHFIWSIYEAVEKPKLPLKLVKFKKELEVIAEKLNDTVEIDNRLPELSPEDKKIIEPILNDEARFTSIQCKYEAVPKKDGVEPKFFELPITNTLSDVTFLETLQKVVE